MPSWDTDTGLAPLSPRPQNLDGMRPKDATDAIIRWFFENFEDPVHSTSYDGREGGYLYVWGPYDAREILEEHFHGVVQEDLIRFAIAEIEGDGVEWVPASSRILPPNEDDPASEASSRSTAELHADMQRKIRDLQEQLAQIEEGRAGIGHNRPPEALDDEPLTRDDRRELSDALDTLANQPVEPSDGGAAAAAANATVGNKRSKVRNWLIAIGFGAITSAISDGIKALALQIWPTIEVTLTNLFLKVTEWLASMPL